MAYASTMASQNVMFRTVFLLMRAFEYGVNCTPVLGMVSTVSIWSVRMGGCHFGGRVYISFRNGFRVVIVAFSRRIRGDSTGKVIMRRLGRVSVNEFLCITTTLGLEL